MSIFSFFKKLSFVAVLGIGVVVGLTAQAQIKRPTEALPGTDFFTLRDQLQAHYATQGTQRGGGYKQFKRWEWFVGQRVDSTGHMPTAKHLVDELTRANLHKDYRSGGDWSIVGPVGTPAAIIGYPAEGIGRISALAFHPTDSNIMWVGAPAGGLWRSLDNGANWENMTPDWPNLGVGDIVINPNHPDTMYLASGDGSVSDTYSFGLLRSTDSGLTWNPTGLTYNIPAGINFRRIALDPLQPHIILAATNDGLKRSTNAGETFINVATGHFTDICWMPFQSDTVFASTYSGSGNAKLYRSVDGGNTWAESPGMPAVNAERIKVRISPANPRRVYVAVSNTNSAFRGLFRSDNAGASFEPKCASPNLFGWEGFGTDDAGTAWYAMDMAVSNTDPDVVVVGSVSPWISTDGGQTFVPFGHWSGDSAPYVHADQHRLAFHPITNQFYSANDGGLFRKARNFNGFNILSNGMSITMYYKMSHGSTQPNTILAGCQDNGTHRLRSGMWTIVFGGDGMQTIIHPEDNNRMFCTTQGGSFYRSVDGGFSFSNDLKPGNIDGQWVTPFILEPGGGPVIYAGWTNKVMRSDDYGTSWFDFSTNLQGGPVSSMDFSLTNPNIMFVSTGTKVYKTTDLGGDWTQVSTGLPTNLSFTGLAVDPFDPNTVWLTMSGYTDGKKVYRTTNGGATWQNMTFDLPNLPANCVVMEKSPEGGVYVGTDAGVYYWQNGATSWEPFMNNLPNVIVTDMKVHDTAQKLRIATFGRGIWESPLNHGFHVGVDEKSSENRLQIWPNPASNAINVNTTALPTGTPLQVIDAYGKMIGTCITQGNITQIEVSGLKPGVYYLRSNSEKRPLGRFVVAL